jgi:hypothetical protein
MGRFPGIEDPDINEDSLTVEADIMKEEAERGNEGVT